MTQKALPSLAPHDVSDLISCYITPWSHSRHTVLFTVLQILYTKQVQDLYICYSSCLKAPPLDSHVVHALTFLSKRTSLTHYFKWLHIFSQSLSRPLSCTPPVNLLFLLRIFYNTYHYHTLNILIFHLLEWNLCEGWILGCSIHYNIPRKVSRTYWCSKN